MDLRRYNLHSHFLVSTLMQVFFCLNKEDVLDRVIVAVAQMEE